MDKVLLALADRDFSNTVSDCILNVVASIGPPNSFEVSGYYVHISLDEIGAGWFYFLHRRTVG
jgi:hypothetical protein